MQKFGTQVQLMCRVKRVENELPCYWPPQSRRKEGYIRKNGHKKHKKDLEKTTRQQ